MLKTLRILISLTLLITIGYLGFITYQQSTIYESTTNEITKACDANGLASERIDEFTAIISLGLVKNETKIALDNLKETQAKAKKLAERYLSYFMGTLITLLLFSFLCGLRAGAMLLSFATFISLIYGLLNPILMVTIHKEVDYLGDVILSFESKGIIGSISKLHESGELAVAFTILLFSILLPTIKSLTLMFMLIFYNSSWNHKLIDFFKQIGKWSMIDVFVVATFLVYFTSNTGGISQAEIQVGLYFFLAYVILSMITAIQTHKVLKEKMTI
jgi:hypothetical protein